MILVPDSKQEFINAKLEIRLQNAAPPPKSPAIKEQPASSYTGGNDTFAYNDEAFETSYADSWRRSRDNKASKSTD